MKIQSYVFISYSQEDTAFVNKLVHDLNDSGVEVWRDVEQIVPGASWDREIEKGIKTASALIYVSSKNSIASKWMEFELQSFLAQNRIVIPIILDDDGAQNLPSTLKQIQWVDARINYREWFKALLAGLSKKLKRSKPIKSKAKKTKGYIFLSYAEEDTTFLNRLKDFLKKHRYAYWDYEESDRDYHNQLFLELEGVITGAAATLSILSPAWKRSIWTIKEYIFSEEVGTPVFLLKARELGPTLVIAGVSYIDFIDNNEKGFEKLERELRRKGL